MGVRLFALVLPLMAWGLSACTAMEDVPWTVRAIRADQLHARGIDGAGLVAAVDDTGLDSTLPHFAGRILESRACGQSGQSAPCVSPPVNSMHGTGVASVLAGRSSAAMGVAPMALLAAGSRPSADKGSCRNYGFQPPAGLRSSNFTDGKLIRDLIIDDGVPVAVINRSYHAGGLGRNGCDSDLVLAKLQTVIACAGGNDHNPEIREQRRGDAYPGVMIVGSVTPELVVAEHSNGGPDIYAPGEGVPVAFDRDRVEAGRAACAEMGKPVDQIAPIEAGTSFAAPHVAGAVVLLRQSAPGATAEEIKAALVGTGRSVLDPMSGTVRPLVDLVAAASALDWVPAPPPGEWRRGLHGPAHRGEVEALSRALADGGGADPRLPVSRATPLHLAALADREEAIRLLLRHGAAIEARDIAGETPLHWAASGLSLNAMKVLISLGADVGARDRMGRTALHQVFTAPSADSTLLDEVIGLLVAAGIDVNARDHEGVTSLDRAILVGNHYGMAPLLRRGAAVTGRDGAGWTPLHHAVLYGRTEIVALLLMHGSDPGAILPGGETPLHLAPSVDVADLLIGYGASPDARDARRRTPLHTAKRPEIAARLIAAGADIHARDAEGETPFHAAARKAGLAQRYLGHLEVLAYHGADVNAVNVRGETPLHTLFRPEGPSLQTGRSAISLMVGVRLLTALCADPSALDRQGKNAADALEELSRLAGLPERVVKSLSRRLEWAASARQDAAPRTMWCDTAQQRDAIAYGPDLLLGRVEETKPDKRGGEPEALVTLRQWRPCVLEGACGEAPFGTFAGWHAQRPSPLPEDYLDQPVRISGIPSAVEYLTWLSSRIGQPLRLPNLAEMRAIAARRSGDESKPMQWYCDESDCTIPPATRELFSTEEGRIAAFNVTRQKVQSLSSGYSFMQDYLNRRGHNHGRPFSGEFILRPVRE